MQKTWKGINEIISCNKTGRESLSSLNVNGVLNSDHNIIAESFNSFFSNISMSIRNKIPFANKNFRNYLPNANLNSIFLSPTSTEEVLNCINNINSNKATGPNSIPPKILNLLKHDLSVTLSKLINLSFSSGTFPSLLKTAKVIPVYKKGSPFEVENYRPISLLSNLDKIFQKLMHKRVIRFLESHKVLYSLQFGFRAKHFNKPL